MSLYGLHTHTHTHAHTFGAELKGSAHSYKTFLLLGDLQSASMRRKRVNGEESEEESLMFILDCLVECGCFFLLSLFFNALSPSLSFAVGPHSKQDEFEAVCVCV